MNQKKAKGLRRLARKFVLESKQEPSLVDFYYKKMKKTYKESKGQI